MGRPCSVKRRKQKKGKFGYHINRRSLNKGMKSKVAANINCDPVRNAWDKTMPAQKNLNNMGLVYSLKELKPKSTAKQIESSNLHEQPSEETAKKNKCKNKAAPSNEVIDTLEKQAVKKRVNTFRFPKEYVRLIHYFMDKYGEDFKAMSKDPKNYYQETPKQIENMIKKFKSIPEQYATYLRERGLLNKKLIKSQS
ncbi:nucleolar protein 16 [Oratosquilla oratoria]|uniref:nucleolar protein 16 n=1 Tax=Oratosquilla oratoria TaxID=337810 RepID=UPI003F7646C0